MSSNKDLDWPWLGHKSVKNKHEQHFNWEMSNIATPFKSLQSLVSQTSNRKLESFSSTHSLQVETKAN